MIRGNLTKRNAFLAQHPILSRCPDWDGDLLFFEIDLATTGLVLVLADSADRAVQAAVVHWGRSEDPSPVLGKNGLPLTREYPTCLLGGDSMQYLDGIRVLDGDPMEPAWRGPDSAPALSMGAAMLSCAKTRPVLRSQQGRIWDDELDRRDEYLRQNHLHIDGITFAPIPRSGSTSIPKPKTYRDPDPTPCVDPYTASKQPSDSELRGKTTIAYISQVDAAVGEEQCEIIGEIDPDDLW